jgi:hypothetical protein
MLLFEDSGIPGYDSMTLGESSRDISKEHTVFIVRS